MQYFSAALFHCELFIKDNIKLQILEKMKKLILLFCLFCVACSTKDEPILKETPTSYQIKNTMPFSGTTGAYWGDLWEVQVFHFNDKSEIVSTSNIGVITHEHEITPTIVTNDVVMVRISFFLADPRIEPKAIRKYDIIRHYLIKGQNNKIDISTTTLVTNSLY